MKSLSRKKKLYYNSFFYLILQVLTIISGFILPKIYISSYGSEVNGLISSITQFLSVISLMDLGIGAVIEASLYKPLANKDNITISKVLKSGDKFFKIVASIFVLYATILCFIYPKIINSNFSNLYTLIFARPVNSTWKKSFSSSSLCLFYTPIIGP